MAFELHVWGPAFGLESIDAECLAAIAAFRHIFTRDEWSLIASNDTTLSPDQTLPVLHHNGTWTSGYSNILTYLTTHAPSQTSKLANTHFTPKQHADNLAYTTYLTTHGPALISLSLYASPHAWIELTRPAYSSLLPFPLTWTIPPSIRAAALEKAESLGLGYLASEAESDALADSAAGAETTATGFLRLRRTFGPARSLQPEQKAAIRIERIAAEFFRTLDEMRGEEGGWFLGAEGPGTLDFLAFGVLRLLSVQTPFPILKRAMMIHSPGSLQFLQRVENVGREYVLPRREPEPRTFLGTLGTFADGAVESIAGAGESWKRWRRGGIKHEGGDESGSAAGVLLAMGSAVVAVGAAVLATGTGRFGEETHRFEVEKEGKGLYQFGEIGAIFDGLPPL